MQNSNTELDILPTQRKKFALIRVFAQAIILTSFFLSIFFILTGIFFGYLGYRKVVTFTQIAEVRLPQLLETFKQGWATEPKQSNGQITFLILGTDQVVNRGNSTSLSDTLLLASLQLASGKISLLSLPRDIWSADYQTKINALYVYGQKKYPAEPQKFPQEVLSQLTNLPIHYTIVLNLETLAELIDLVGGVQVMVPEGFVDHEFPRSDVDITQERDPKKLYKTVRFDQGEQKMDGSRALEYIRSRHAQGDQGDDTARNQRQQQIVLALVNSFKNPRLYLDEVRTAHLYRFYQEKFAQYLPLTDLIGLAKKMIPTKGQVSFSTESLSIFPDNKTGVITHPKVQPNKYQGQWVYEIRDVSAFSKEVAQKLKMPK